MSRAVPRPVLLSTSSERAGPWGHTAAFQPSPSCGSTAWGAGAHELLCCLGRLCVPQSPGTVRGAPLTLAARTAPSALPGLRSADLVG